MKYRPEIDGLRAIAVLIVLIFHLNSNFLPAGFIGVDIFFVISGYLITSIITKSIEKGGFDYKTFYTKRIKRLLPLFFAVVLFTLLAGYFILLPEDYEGLGSNIIASNFFLANVRYALKANYFEADHPLLHFWSLAVEEQFYFIMPTLLVIINRFFKKYLIPILIVMIVGSLGLAEWMSGHEKYSKFSYFLLPTRAWELLFGCLLAVIKLNLSPTKSTVISILGLCCIILGLGTIHVRSVFPGFVTLFPVLGTLFLIMGGEHGVGKILKWKPLVFIGLASYSIYMWHWPIIIFVKSVFGIHELSIMQSLLLGSIIIAVGYLSQIFIEDYFRFKKFNFRKTVSYYFILPFLVSIGFAYYVYSHEGMPERYNIDEKYTYTNTAACSNSDIGCFITSNNNINSNVLMIGDSHAEHFSNLFAKWFDDRGLSLRLFSSGGCNFYSASYYTSSCEDVKIQAVAAIDKVNTIIMAKRFDKVYKDEIFLKEFSAYVTKLTAAGKNVILLKQVPKFEDVAFIESWMMAKRYGLHFDYESNTLDNSFVAANARITELFANNERVHILDFNPLFLINDRYKKFDEEKFPIYYNSNHLTAHGAEWIYEKIKNDKKYDWVINMISPS